MGSQESKREAALARPVVASLDAVDGLPPLLGPGGRWVYLGKDVERQAAIAGTLGEPRRLLLGERVHVAAESLRRPFLDFIASLGKMQRDQIGWWSSSCSWKDMERSRLFLLICYERVTLDLLRESLAGGPQVIVVLEDPWLFHQLKSQAAGMAAVHFEGEARLWPACLKAAVWGTGSRLLWAVRLLRNGMKQYGASKLSVPRFSGKKNIAVYSDPQARCFEGLEGWRDPYLGDLGQVLEKAGYPVLRFSSPESGGYERELARRAQYFAPLSLWLSPLRLLQSVFASWRPCWSDNPHVAGLPIRELLRREWWLDRWRSSYVIFRVFLDCFTRFLDHARPQAVIFPYENQPWEKLLVLAARDRGVPCFGYQHGAGLARFMLAYFQGSGEVEWAPLPDVIFTSGQYSHELLNASGVPSARLVMGGNFRHQYLWKRAGMTPPPQIQERFPLLIALPVEPDLAQHLLHALQQAFPDGGHSDGMEFLVKPHPMCPLTEYCSTWPATMVNGNFEDALRRCAAVLYSGSGTGMEAIVLGRVVLRYRSELLLNTDYSDLPAGDTVVDCLSSNLRDKVLSLRHAPSLSPSRQVVESLLKRVFPLPDTAAWLEVVERLSRRGNGECCAAG